MKLYHRNRFRGMLASMLLAYMLAALFGLSDVSAAEMDAGGTRGTAMTMKLGEVCQEMTADGSDQDFFRFTTTGRGYFQVSLAHNASDPHDTEDGWAVKVMDDNGDEITSVSNIKENWTSIVLPYADKGKEFYVRVSPANQYWAAKNCVYDLRVDQTVTQDWEAENNDTMADATQIKLNQTYHGITVGDADEDYFKFITGAQGYFQINLTHNAADANHNLYGWDIRVLDEIGNEIISESNIKEHWTSMPLPYAKKGKCFYVKVSPNSQYMGPKDCAYDLRVEQKAANHWEVEPNDTKTAATVIKAGMAYNGITLASEDEDYYRMDIPAAGILRVQFHNSDANREDPDYGWDVVIYDNNSNEASRVENVKTSKSVSLNVGKGPCYILVKGHYVSIGPVLRMYRFSITYRKTVSKPKMVSASAAGKTANIKWRRVSDAAGYYVYRSTKRNTGYRKVKIITDGRVVLWKNRKLKKGTYYYKVAAYSEEKGEILVSDRSEAALVRVQK